MGSRGHDPFEGRIMHAPGMMRHGPFPGFDHALHPRVLDALHVPDLTENKIAAQAAEMEQLAKENQRLAATHVSLRQELAVAQQEMQRVQARIGNIQTDSDIQISRLLEKIVKMEADVRAGESLKRELQEAHLEAKDLIRARQELNFEIQKATQDLAKAHADLQNLPDLQKELDGLKQEHQRLRSTFEYKKGLNMEQVERMQVIERNLISMAREVEKLRAEVANSELRASAGNSYGGTFSDSAYSHMHQGGPPSASVTSYGPAYVSTNSYQHAAQGSVHSGYPDAFGRPQGQMAPAEGLSPYGVADGGSATRAWGMAGNAHMTIPSQPQR